MQSLTLQQVKEKLKTLDDKTLSNMLKQRQDNTSDLRENFWMSKNGNVNIKNYYYMMNPNIIPFIDRECEDMRKGNYKRFLNLIKEKI